MANEHGTHVLVVDDEAGFRDLLTRILEPAGYKVQTATNAHEALNSIAQSAPAVAICDIHMPGPTGLWLASQIREQSPATAMVLATVDSSVPPTESMRRGIVAYILKPYRRHEVLSAVAQAYRWWSAESGEEVPALVPVASSAGAPSFSPPSGYSTASERASLPGRSKTRLVVAIAALVVAALGVAAAMYMMSHTSSQVLSRVAASAGMVLVYDGAGKLVMQGSGFFIEPELFVTNHHVVNGGMSAKVVSGAAEYRVAGVAAGDRQHDLVLLETTSPAPQHLTLADAAPDMGDAVSVYGAPLGLRGTLSTGIVSTARDDTGGRLQITAPISPGSSGSPVVNKTGAVVGVAVSSNALGQGLNFAVPAAYVRELLRSRGEVQPLLAASRGGGGDRERHDLLGPVRVATVFSEEPLVAMLARLTAEYTRTMPPAEARQRAQQDAIAASRTQLIFDRDGRLVETRLGDGSVRKDVPMPRTLDGEAQVAREELDATGNPARRVYADGSEVTFRYQLDPRGNWVSREAVRRDAAGRTSVSTGRRDIEYWE